MMRSGSYEGLLSLPLYEFPGAYILLPVTSYTFPCVV